MFPQHREKSNFERRTKAESKRENRLMSQTIFIMLTANDEGKKNIIATLFSYVHSCIQSQSRSRRVKLPFISCFSSTTKFFSSFLALGAFHKKQTRIVHQQHQKLFNIKMNVYEEKRVKQRMREGKSIT